MRIAVFCASARHVDDVYVTAAARLGKLIGESGWELIYGGTNVGLMKVVAEATMEAGGKVTGIIPECIHQRGWAAEGLDQLIIAPDMKERKFLLREHSDAFVALPGGWGTLEEITEVITLKQLGQHCKPIVFLNTAGFYTKLMDFIDAIEKSGFIAPIYRQLYEIVNHPEELMEAIIQSRKKEFAGKY